MDRPLTPLHFLERAGTLFGDRPVVEATPGGVVRRSWREVRTGADRVAAALAAEGLAPGERVAVLAWNTIAHLELYFAVPAAGGILLTVNVRLSAEQIGRILAHAEPSLVLAEAGLTPLADEALATLGTDAPPTSRARLPLAGLPEPDPRPPLPEPAEEDPLGLCYTSGTTGAPKGVLYTHRALALHTMAICLPDAFALSEADVVLPAVPMFHANGWGLPWAAAMVGAGLVLPGPRPDPERLADLLSDEGVTFAAGVPTVWAGVLEALRRRPRPLAEGLRIHSGGAPTPPALLEAYREELGVEILTGWGMTELTPVGMVTRPRADMADWSPEELLPVRTSQGSPLPFVERRVVDEAGRSVPHDGRTPGELEVRGPWVTDGYYRAGADGAFRDGWLRTGDVATVDARGFARLVDRTKDLIRSGGEWISSVQVEHCLTDHPAVAEAAVVAVPDPRWGERPVACVVWRAGERAPAEALFERVRERYPSWWAPDRLVELDALPRTATGKYDKRALREWVRGP